MVLALRCSDNGGCGGLVCFSYKELPEFTGSKAKKVLEAEARGLMCGELAGDNATITPGDKGCFVMYIVESGRNKRSIKGGGCFSRCRVQPMPINLRLSEF